jgi:uncharacterized protein YuzE
VRLEYSAETDAAYIYFVDRPIRRGEATEQVVIDNEQLGDVIFDLDANGRLLGLELPYNARSLLPDELFAD